jgi:hypothetical protein
MSKAYVLIIIVAVLIGAGAWATRNGGQLSTTATMPPSATQPVSFTLSSTADGNSITSSSAIALVSLQPSDFNNVSYVGCVWKNSGHTYIRVNITLTNRLNATVDYQNVSVVFSASEVSNGFQASESYTQLVSGPVNASVLRIPIQLPIDNVVSGAFFVEVFVKGASSQVEAIRLSPSISVAPSDYQHCPV